MTVFRPGVPRVEANLPFQLYRRTSTIVSTNKLMLLHVHPVDVSPLGIGRQGESLPSCKARNRDIATTMVANSGRPGALQFSIFVISQRN
jgi:hypothetical protein